jgi:hypothetical protein
MLIQLEGWEWFRSMAGGWHIRKTGEDPHGKFRPTGLIHRGNHFQDYVGNGDRRWCKFCLSTWRKGEHLDDAASPIWPAAYH